MEHAITCPKYQPGDGRRCRHYLQGGSCALPDEVMCVEWIKRNGSATAAKARPPDPPPEMQPDQLLRGLTDEEIRSFKALGVEMCLRTESCGEMWLVPHYTDKPRNEITPEHAASLARLTSAFPGARIVAFHKQPRAKASERSAT